MTIKEQPPHNQHRNRHDRDSGGGMRAGWGLLVNRARDGREMGRRWAGLEMRHVSSPGMFLFLLKTIFKFTNTYFLYILQLAIHGNDPQTPPSLQTQVGGVVSYLMTWRHDMTWHENMTHRPHPRYKRESEGLFFIITAYKTKRDGPTFATNASWWVVLRQQQTVCRPMKTGPNDAFGVVWAISKFFPFFLSCFINTNY